jgi:hypothetical protein
MTLSPEPQPWVGHCACACPYAAHSILAAMVLTRRSRKTILRYTTLGLGRRIRQQWHFTADEIDRMRRRGQRWQSGLRSDGSPFLRDPRCPSAARHRRRTG